MKKAPSDLESQHIGNDTAFLRSLFQAGVDAVDPQRTIGQFLPDPPKNPRGCVYVLAVGKAAVSLTQAFEIAWQERHPRVPLKGTAITRYGHGGKTQFIEVIEAAHPIPNSAGIAATQKVIHDVSELTEHDVFVALITGGGSALMTATLPGISAGTKRDITQQLLRSGATIRDINCVRRHLSAIKGGRLAKLAYPARIHNILLSDVPGDHISCIASGATVPDESTSQNALDILKLFDIPVIPSVRRLLKSKVAETIKPSDPIWNNVETHLLSTAQIALDAIAQKAQSGGYYPVILGDAVEGEARDVAAVMAALTRQIITWKQPWPAPVALISGGETTVTVRGGGKGGRNTEFLLAFACKINELIYSPSANVESLHLPLITAVAADSDGIDGTQDNAGAFCNPTTIQRMLQAGINPKDSLAQNNSYAAFSAIDDLFFTGPTNTNVNDIRVILIKES